MKNFIPKNDEKVQKMPKNDEKVARVASFAFWIFEKWPLCDCKNLSKMGIFRVFLAYFIVFFTVFLLKWPEWPEWPPFSVAAVKIFCRVVC